MTVEGGRDGGGVVRWEQREDWNEVQGEFEAASARW